MISWLAYWLVKFLGRTQRLRVDDPIGIIQSPPQQQFIFTFWHNRLALMPYFYCRFFPNRRAAAMISASRDGTRLTILLHRFGFVPVRGSTSRFGSQALKELAERVREGYDAGITPDGPRGPRYRAQQGAVGVAQLTGAPIIPASYRLSWKIQLKSWDGFLIPLPFGRCELKIGKPIEVPPDADDKMREQKLQELQTALLELGGDTLPPNGDLIAQ